MVDRHAEKLQTFAGAALATERIAEVMQADLAIVAVKPQATPAALRELGKLLPAVIVSVAAGVTGEALTAAAPKGSLVVRAMMNTAVAHGQGAVVLCAESECPPWLALVLSPLGEVYELPEKLFEAANAVSACAPAFFLTAIDGLADGAVRLGIPRATAVKLSLAAARAAVAVGSASSVAAAKAAIVSPGGSTAAGLTLIERGAVRAAFADAAEASALAARQKGVGK